MTITADRMAAAYFDAFETLCRVTPKGGYAERGTARAGVTQAGVATLNAAYDRSTEPDLGSLDEMATEVGRQAAHWSIIVRGAAGDQVADLAARHGLVERTELPLLACAAERPRVPCRLGRAPARCARSAPPRATSTPRPSPAASRFPRASSAR